nr:META domain-containing protein [Chitinophagaceae bacterium]
MFKNSFQFSLYLFIFGICCFQCSVPKKKSTNTGSHNATANAPVAKDSPTDKGATNTLSIQGSWEFDNFTMVNTSKTILFPMEVPMLHFDTKTKKFSGKGGCNNISGGFVLNGNELSFTQPYIMTRMSCNAMGEKLFVDYLNSIKRYNINENTLELIGDAKPVIIMKRVVK